MSATTHISWATKTWNPSLGCSRVSAGCLHCYVVPNAHRLAGNPNPTIHAAYEGLTARHGNGQLDFTGTVRLIERRLAEPYGWRSPEYVFVNSMSDLFHEALTDTQIARVFAVMADCPRHTFMILTKRPQRAATWPGPWAANIWVGTSVEDSRVLHRIDTLRRCPARVRFLSCEPLIGPLGDLDLGGIHWVIVGGESGPGYRPMDHAWARLLLDQCRAAGVAFWYKQGSGLRPGKDDVLDGVRWQQRPTAVAP